MTGLFGSTIAAKEEVTTIRLTDGALALTAWRIPVVPLIAVVIKSSISDSVFALKW